MGGIKRTQTCDNSDLDNKEKKIYWICVCEIWCSGGGGAGGKTNMLSAISK